MTISTNYCQPRINNYPTFKTINKLERELSQLNFVNVLFRLAKGTT